MPAVPQDLIAHVATTSGLSAGAARRLVEDVIAYYAEPVAPFVARRHRELAAAGWRNDEIYARLRDEVAERLFAGPAYSTRQIRRLIYG